MLDWIDTVIDLMTNGTLSSSFQATDLVYTTAGLSVWITIFHMVCMGLVGITTKHPGATGAYGLLVSIFLILKGILTGWGVYVSYVIIVVSIALVLYQLFGTEDR